MTDAPVSTPAQIQVLVMDDSRSARFAIGKFLEGLGCAVASVGDLAAALDYLDRHPVGMMLLEHDPADTAFEALRSIKQQAGDRRLPVVLCLSDDVPGFAGQAAAHGAAGVLIKPPTRDSLAELLTELMPGLALSPQPEPPAPAAYASAEAENDTDTDDQAPPEQADTRGQRIAQELANQSDDIREGIASLHPSLPAATSAPASAPLGAAIVQPSPPPPADGIQARLQQLEARLAVLEQNVQRELMDLRVQLDLGLQAQSARIDQSRETLRAMVTEEAQAVAERTVMGAAAKISDRLAESILKTLGRG